MTQNETILEYLKGGHTITSLEALDLFGCFRLASRINDLKNLNSKEWVIKDQMESNGEKHYKRYWLEWTLEVKPVVVNISGKLMSKLLKHKQLTML